MFLNFVVFWFIIIGVYGVPAGVAPLRGGSHTFPRWLNCTGEHVTPSSDVWLPEVASKATATPWTMVSTHHGVVPVSLTRQLPTVGEGKSQ